MTEHERVVQRLFPHERHIACLLIALLLGLAFSGLKQGDMTTQNACPLTVVKVVGAVDSVELTVPIGTTVDEVLERVLLDKEANIVEIDGMKKINTQTVLVIPFNGKKTFYVCGAVKRPTLVVLEGEASAQKILESIQVEETANIKAFLRRRVFPNGSVIEVKKSKAKREKKPQK
jgi:hypothetical protein